MSKWTYITAAIRVESYGASPKLQHYIQKILKQAPAITGSEGGPSIFVNVLKGHNVSIVKPNQKTIRYQTNAVITIVGSLRDREAPQTCKELLDFVEFLKEKKLGIEEIAIDINDNTKIIKSL